MGLTKALNLQYLKRDFKPQGTTNYELKISNFGIAPREKT